MMYRVLLVWAVCVAAALAVVHWQELSLHLTPFLALALVAAMPSVWFSVKRLLARPAPRRRNHDDATTRVIVT